MSERLPDTITSLLQRARTMWPDRPYLQVRTGERLTSLSFAEVAEKSERMAALLAARGVRPGDRVGLLAENRPEWVISYFAVLLTGATVVPVDSLMPPVETTGILRMTDCKLLIASERYYSALAVSAGFADPPSGHLLLDADLPSVASGLPDLQTCECKADDVAVIICTSGTTGLAKGVMLTHRNLCADVQGLVDTNVLHSDDIFLLLLPLFHTYSSTVNMLLTLALGSRAMFATSYKSRDIADDIRIGRISVLVGVPQVFENLMIAIRRAVREASPGKRVLFSASHAFSAFLAKFGVRAGQWFFRSLRMKAGFATLTHMISGGAALRPEVNRFFRTLGFDLMQGYGLSETSPVLTVNRPDANRIGSVGTALPGIELRIDEPDEDGVGEICARGAVVMKGYYKNEDATRDVLKDGWLHTGDAGRLDRDGYLYITGRLKNVIITGAGKNVYPEEIEAQLNLSPFILESLVVGVTGKRGAGEELAAVIVPDQAFVQSEIERGTEANIETEIKAVVDSYNHSAAAYRRIRRWKIQREEFEKTSTRKIKRFLYRNPF